MIRKALPELRPKWESLATMAVFLGLWQGLVMLGVVRETILPAPTEVCSALFSMVATGELLPDVLDSVKRVLSGFFLATIVAVPLGMLSGWNPRVERALVPPLELLRPIPPIAWVPLAILWFGIGDRPSYFITFLAAFFPIFLNTFEGVRQIEPRYFYSARLLGATPRQMVRDVLIPAAFPFVLTGLRLGLGVAWMSVVAAELIGAQSGLGYMIQLHRMMLATEKVLGGMVAIGCIGYLMNLMLLLVEKRLIPWKTAAF